MRTLHSIAFALWSAATHSFPQVNYGEQLDSCHPNTKPNITAEDIRARIQILAADSMEGRDTPSKGLDRAMRYVANELLCLGIRSALPDNSYIQYYPLRGTRAPNAIGIIEGNDPTLKHEYVVFSAHIDHVGIGPPVKRDSIYNGADDNASGVAVVLEIAEMIASSRQKPKRSIVFFFPSDEEKSMAGSKWFMQHPPVPLRNIVADVNVDMVGRNWHHTVVVIGKHRSSLGLLADSIARANAELDLVAIDDSEPFSSFWSRSDHYQFALRNIPAISFFSGLHEDYHRPGDETDKILFEKVSRIAQLAGITGITTANILMRPRIF